jgi:hypothetical protein
MAIKLTPWTQAHPGSALETNAHRCHLFANSGVQYLRACAAIATSYETYGFGWYVELPLMHQAIELLLKAHAARVDPSFSPRRYGHRTVDLIKDYSPLVPVFSALVADQTAMDLIEGLQQAWLSVRYAEVVVEYSGPDYNQAGNIGNLLADEYFRETGVPLQAHHFQKRKQ